MVKIKEYRVVLPLTVEEYQRGQLYCLCEASKNETGGGEGIEVIKNEPFSNFPLLGGRFKAGIYTYKIYHLQSKVPPFIRMLAPKGALQIHEEAWNAYPYCKTIVTNPLYMKDKFFIIIESLHLADKGQSENVLGLGQADLKHRKVVMVDIGNDPVTPADYKCTGDPAKFVSQKTGRGPLKDGWVNDVKPVMTCYKLITVEFKWFGLQNRIENYIHKVERRLITTFHRNVFCWIDRWIGLSMKDIRDIEEKTKRELDEQRNKGKVRGMTAEADTA